MKYFLVFISLCTFVYAKISPIKITPDGYVQTKDFQIVDSKVVTFDRIGWQKFYGISALAYDSERQILYMLSDRSRLFKFKLTIHDDKIVQLKAIWGHRLLDKQGRKFFIRHSDSEGMTLVEKGDQKILLVSFEQFPKVMAFDLNGRELNKNEYNLTRLYEPLNHIKTYRAKNTMLESITYSKKFGVIVTPEYPIARKPFIGPHALYNRNGVICSFKKTNPYGAITELETMPDGNLLALQREFNFETFKTIISLEKIYLDHQKDGVCQTKDVVNMTKKAGWKLDNFEGLTHIKDNLYLIISDDNGNIFQKTLLVLFRI